MGRGHVGERQESVFANMFRQYRKGEFESNIPEDSDETTEDCFQIVKYVLAGLEQH